MNRPKKTERQTSSKYIGVRLDVDKRWGKGKYRYWRAFIKQKCIGNFRSEELAALAYNRVAIQVYGPHANLNNVGNEIQ